MGDRRAHIAQMVVCTLVELRLLSGTRPKPRIEEVVRVLRVLGFRQQEDMPTLPNVVAQSHRVVTVSLRIFLCVVINAYLIMYSNSFAYN